jgi:hypothetical protein
MRGNKTRSLANEFVLNKQQNLGLTTVTYIKPLISHASREVHRRTGLEIRKDWHMVSLGLHHSGRR